MVQPQLEISKDNHKTADTYNPATNELHQTYIMHNEEDLNNIAENAHEAFLKLRNISFEERAK